jgi:hypothetical protein
VAEMLVVRRPSRTNLNLTWSRGIPKRLDEGMSLTGTLRYEGENHYYFAEKIQVALIWTRDR